MKDSGIEWIGQVPDTWKVVKAKYIFENHKEIAGKNQNKYDRLSLTLKGVLKRSRDDTKGLQSESLETYQILRKGELVFKMIDLNNVSTSRVGYSPYEGLVSPVYIIFHNPKYSRFGYYYFFSMWQREIYNHLGNDGVRSSLNASDMLSLPFLVPPLSEQQKIADFLDEKMKEIDKAIGKTKETIELYKKYKQAIITEAVTKGIVRHEVKDSRNPYIGEINKEWHVTKITHLLDYSHPYAIGDGDHGSISADDYADEGIPFIRVKNLGWATNLDLSDCVYITKEQNDTIKNSTLKPGDILFAKTGATIGKTAFVPNNIPVSNTTSHVGKITIDNNKHNPKFFYYVLSSQIAYRQFWAIASLKTTRPELSIDEIKTLMVTVPSAKDEENSIVEWLDNICKHIDSIISQKFELIDEYNSYKKSVIYEYVTGKKEVK